MHALAQSERITARLAREPQTLPRSPALRSTQQGVNTPGPPFRKYVHFGDVPGPGLGLV